MPQNVTFEIPTSMETRPLRQVIDRFARSVDNLPNPCNSFEGVDGERIPICFTGREMIHYNQNHIQFLLLRYNYDYSSHDLRYTINHHDRLKRYQDAAKVYEAQIYIHINGSRTPIQLQYGSLELPKQSYDSMVADNGHQDTIEVFQEQGDQYLRAALKDRVDYYLTVGGIRESRPIFSIV